MGREESGKWKERKGGQPFAGHRANAQNQGHWESPGGRKDQGDGTEGVPGRLLTQGSHAKPPTRSYPTSRAPMTECFSYGVSPPGLWLASARHALRATRSQGHALRATLSQGHPLRATLSQGGVAETDPSFEACASLSKRHPFRSSLPGRPRSPGPTSAAAPAPAGLSSHLPRPASV